MGSNFEITLAPKEGIAFFHIADAFQNVRLYGTVIYETRFASYKYVEVKWLSFIYCIQRCVNKISLRTHGRKRNISR